MQRIGDRFLIFTIMPGRKYSIAPTRKIPEYRTWATIKQRCYNPNNTKYHLYGGKGIKMCDRWLTSFENFLADMGPKPSSKHTIERLKSNLDYGPDNCRWATTMEQNANTSRNVYLTYQGETLHISAWARRYGIPKTTITKRIRVHKWSVERAITEPPRPQILTN